jgi:MFS family permease
MWDILRNRTYRHLFFAQVIALVGTGLATVALGLLAYDLAGSDAGQVLGTALAIKMVAYVVVSPVATALLGRLPRRPVLVTFDLLRLVVALALPWVDAVWQVYVLIFLLQASSATFTPTFQATIPDVLPEEADYTRALSLSRLAYDLETLLSPLLAAALLTVVSSSTLFFGTAGGFLVSALLVMSVRLPAPRAPAAAASFRSRLTRGMRLYIATPRLRGLLALSLTAAAGGALVIVNTVVIVRDALGHTDTAVAIALAAYGAGSMVFALLMPRLLDRWSDRGVMLAGGALVTAGLIALALVWTPLLQTSFAWPTLLGLWAVMGAGYAALVTPSGRLLRRSSSDADRPALFAAQFSLSHACWLLTYPLVGWLGARAGLDVSIGAMAAIAAVGVVLAWRLWPRVDPDAIAHAHPDLPADHPHLLVHAAGESVENTPHAHAYVIDDLHVRWPSR